MEREKLGSLLQRWTKFIRFALSGNCLILGAAPVLNAKMEQENFFHTDYSFLWHFWPSLMFYYCRYLASSCRQAQWREFSNTEIVQNNISNYFLRTQNLYMRHSLHLADGKEDKLFILKKHIPCSKVASQNIYFSY